jgi:glyoxylase-like metal-dependent hydrolase (beta-lactamase superfamily II)
VRSPARFNVGRRTPIPLRVTAQSLGPYGTNCFIVSSVGAGEALVVDPGAEPERIRRSLEAGGLRCGAILVTHTHHDHIGAVGALARDGSVPVYVSRGEASILSAPRSGLPGGGEVEGYEADVLLEGGDAFEEAGLAVEAIAVPGHSPAALAFRVTAPDGDEAVFVGDAIFAGSVGRTDLPGASWPVLERSLLALFDAVGLDVPIHPGHGPSTTLRRERATNPFLDAVRAR